MKFSLLHWVHILLTLLTQIQYIISNTYQNYWKQYSTITNNAHSKHRLSIVDNTINTMNY